MSSFDTSIDEVMKAIYYTKLVETSAYAILVYDYCLTFRQEKEFLWNAPLGWGKMLFIIIRYLTLISMTFIMTILFMPGLNVEMYVMHCSSDYANSSSLPGLLSDVCLVWSRMEWIVGIIIIMLTELTLMLRLYAMYDESRTIFAILALSYIATFGIALGFIGKIVSLEGNIFLSVTPEVFICAPTNTPPFYRETWVSVFIHEVFLLSLAVFRGIQLVKRQGGKEYVSRFTMFLVEDSVRYYFAVFAVFASLELVWVILGVSYIELPFGMAIIIASTMSQRLLLKIREQYYSHNTRPIPSRSQEGESIMLSSLGSA